MLVTPKYVNPPKEGKKFGNIKLADDSVIWFKRDAFAFEKDKTYWLETKDEVWGDKPVKVITTARVQAEAAPATAGANVGGLTGDELRFVSNIVGTAIEAGKIGSPHEISVWAKAAAATLKDLA